MMIVPCIVVVAAGVMAVEPIWFDQRDEEAMIDYMNSNQPHKTEAPVMSYEDFESRLMDPQYLDMNEEKLLRKAPIKFAAGQDNLNIRIPRSFDAREKWPKCKSIKLIRNQGNCGSCWAVSAASVLSDRLCIASGQKIQTLLSATDILSCCEECSPTPCNGSSVYDAWAYIKSHGICSGGSYNTTDVCKPYVFPPCGYSKKGNYGPCDSNKALPKPTCLEECLQDYKKSYTEDKVYLDDYPYKVPNNTAAIQMEIMKNGPVQAVMAVYEDFYNHVGFYFHRKGSDKPEASHAVKIIGWGVEEIKNVNLTYWLVSNSWGAEWGEDGLFRIARRANDFNCEIEQHVYAGLPKIQ